MTYTEKELDQFLHGISLSLLSKKSAQHWRYDGETAKEIEWLEALERKVRADKADRKTENSSEKPNNCEDLQDWKDRMWAEAIVTEPTISKMEQVDKDINVRSKDKPQPNADQHVQRIEYVGNDEKSRCWTCKHFERMHETPISSDGSYYTYVVCTAKECKYEPKDEPQTERSSE